MSRKEYEYKVKASGVAEITYSRKKEAIAMAEELLGYTDEVIIKRIEV